MPALEAGECRFESCLCDKIQHDAMVSIQDFESCYLGSSPSAVTNGVIALNGKAVGLWIQLYEFESHITPNLV